MEGLGLWKPLYYISIGLFIISIVLFPVSSTWSIIIALFLVSIWSKIPGFVHFIFNQLSLNDFFIFIISAHVNGLIGGLFGVSTMLAGQFFGPNTWPPYTFRSCVSYFVGGLSMPLILNFTGGVNIAALFAFEGVSYAIYYLLVILFWREEIGLEIAILPLVIFFDFFLNAIWLKSFGVFLDKLVTGGVSSGWPFLIFAGIVLGFILLARNSKKAGDFLESLWNRFGGKKETKEEIFVEKLDKGERF